MAISSNSYMLLSRLAEKRSERRDFIDLLMVGFGPSESDSILSLIRSSGLSPRGRTLSNLYDLTDALANRSWDILLCTTEPGCALSPTQVVELIKSQGRDLPVIQLEREATPEQQLVAVQQGIAYLMPKDAQELLIYRVLREYNLLRDRRKLHLMEFNLEQAQHIIQRLVDASSVAIAYIEQGQISYTNASFRLLFGEAKQYRLSDLGGLQTSRAIEDLIESGNFTTPKKLTYLGPDHSRFDARTELIEQSINGTRLVQLHIDPLNLEEELGPDSEEPSSAPHYPDENILASQLEQYAKAALRGGNDVFLVYLHIDLQQSTKAELDESLLTDCLHGLIDEIGKQIPNVRPAMLQRLDCAFVLEESDQERTKQVVTDLLHKLHRYPIQIEGIKPHRKIKIGIAAINDNAPKTAALLSRARDSAYGAPDDNPIAFYQDADSLQLKMDAASHELEEAIKTRRLRLLYQPLVDLHKRDGQRAFEVLIRMLDQDDNERLPGQFMQSLDQASVMVKLDHWVVESTLFALQRALCDGDKITLFINIARRTLRSKAFAPWLAKQLNELELPGHHIVLEISETDAAADLDYAIVFCNAIRRVGCSVCIKHYGCSTNSIKVYNRLRPAYVKLDGSFIEELNSGPKGQQAIRHLLAPVKQNDCLVIAPLVEDISMLGNLYQIGVNYVQGYYIQPPQASMSYEYFRDE